MTAQFLRDPAPAAGQAWKLVLAYDGTDYSGWQVQPGLHTVQGELARVLREVTGESLLPQGSGRTDTGVHAEGQTVSLHLQAAIPPDRLLRALNRRLPSSIRVLEAQHAGPDFHARANVVSKLYEYRIFPRRQIGSQEERICPPALARYAWDCHWPLHLETMQTAARAVVGTHDFTSFAAHDPDRNLRERDHDDSGDVPAPRSNVRTIFSSAWSLEDGLLCYRVRGSGFLHHMVRNLVGTFVEVGAGRIDPAAIATILGKRVRAAAGMTAPPQGLFLMQVNYRTAEGFSTELSQEPVKP